jgi:hypothetical protein
MGAGNRVATWICRLPRHPPRPSFPSTVPLFGPSKPLLPANSLSLCLNEHCLITIGSFIVSLHVRSADGSVPRLRSRAVPEESRPLLADTRAPSGRSQAECSGRNPLSTPPGSGPSPRMLGCCGVERSRGTTRQDIDSLIRLRGGEPVEF